MLTFECGPQSTTVTAPILDTVVSAAEDFTSVSYSESSTLDRTYGFQVSNPNCPVTGVVLDSGSNYFTLTYQTGGSYTVSLSETASRKVGSYSYTATAEAEGGASETVSQTFTVTRRCQSAEKSTLITDTATSESAGRTHLLYIPATSTENVDIFESSASYVDDPTPDDGPNGACG